MIDMHIHSNSSDGDLSPQQIAKSALEKGLDGFIITDHHKVSGNLKARKYSGNLITTTGIEITASYSNVQLHILGYFFDPKKIFVKLSEFKLSSEDYNRELADIVMYEGNNLPDNLDYALDNYLFKAEIAAYLVESGQEDSMQEAIKKIIQPCQNRVARVNAFDAVESIVQSGGAAAIAHPGILNGELNLQKMLYELSDKGLKGIEVDTPVHTSSQRNEARKYASMFKLVPIGGSDYHRSGKEIGCETTSTEKYYELKSYCQGTEKQQAQEPLYP